MTSNNGNVGVSSSQAKPSDSKTKTDNVSELYIVATGCLIFMGVAVVSFYFVIHQFYGKKTNKFLDAYYYTIVLMTSSGYKDLTPYNNLAILLAIFFTIMGIVIFGALMSLGADLLLVTQPENKEFLNSVKTHKTVQYPSTMKKKWKVLAIMLAVHIFVGTPLLAFIGNMAFFRALYCVSSTITTVLSTDKCFSTKARRIIALFWILYGIITLSCVLYTFSEAWTHRSNWLFLKKNIKRNPGLQDLQPSDLDDDGFIQLAEYIYCKLKEKQRLRGETKEITIEDVRRALNKESGKQTERKASEQVEGLNNVDTHPPRMEHSNGGNQDSSITPKPFNFKDHIAKLHNPDDIRNIVILFVIYLVSSTVIFYVVRDHISGKKTNSFLDAVYFSFVIMTSVGYGDLSPDDDDPLALIFASLFSLVGLFVTGLVLSMALKVLDIQQEDRRRKMDPKKQDQTTATKESKKVIRKKCIIIVLLFLIHMALGTAILILIEDLGFIHALYCISITITSAGTEKCFSTKLGRVFALVLMLFGAIYKSYVLFAFTEIYTEMKQRSRGRAKRNITPPEPIDSRPPKPLACAKADHDHVYGYGHPCGSVPIPLQEEPDDDDLMMMILPLAEEIDEHAAAGVPTRIPEDPTEEGMPAQLKDDIVAIMEEFRRLDVSGTGRLTLREVMMS